MNPDYIMKPLTLPLSNIKRFFITYISTVKLVWSTNKKSFIQITLANSINGILVYPSLLVNKLLIDSVIISITAHDPSKGIKTIIFASFLSLAIDRVQQILSEIDWTISTNLSNTISEHVRVNISQKINDLPVSIAEDPKTRNQFQKVFDTSGRSVWSLVIPISTFPETVFSIISTAIPIFTFQPLILVPSIILAIPHIIIGMDNSKAQHTLSTAYSSKWRIWAALEDFVNKGRFLYENKILHHVHLLNKRRLTMSSDYYGKRKQLDINFAKKRQIVSLPLALFQTSTKLYLYYRAIQQVITLGTAQITSGAIDRFISNVSRLIRQANDVFQNYLFITDYESFMSLPNEDLTTGLPMPHSIKQGIEFRHVWFKYPHSPKWILRDVSFIVRPTDNIAIVGENGAGKSTLIKLLCRFYTPTKGDILIDGLNVKHYRLQEYRRQLSALFQDFAQYPFSVEDNICFGDIHKKRSPQNIQHAAKLTDITHFVHSLPQGFKNPLDKEFDQGIEPSKGLWQRIALSRTLYRDSRILILDEPTSNVDPASEEVIFSEVLKVAKDKIIFLVSHRFSTVRKADMILVLEHGQVVAYGNHHDLLRRSHRYQELFHIQAQGYQ